MKKKYKLKNIGKNIKRGYNLGKMTYEVVKRDLGIKTGKKKRWATPNEFGRAMFGI